MSDNGPKIELAGCRDLDGLVPLVRAYHEFEHVVLSDAQRVAALKPLLTDASLGRIWLIRMRGCLVGYIAVCFGYSIEFTGKDAFVDEFFIEPDWRGRGVGGKVLAAICREATRLGIRALHLEVARNNHRAIALYQAQGFDNREQFHMMSRVL